MNAPSWSGLGDKPLPFESSYSILARFGSSNVQGASQMYRTFSGAKALPRDLPFTSESWARVLSNPHLFQQETGWRFSENEGEVSHIFRFWGGERRLRICPLCLECGYHSYLYQFKALWLCPIHECLLTARCFSCDQGLPVYGLSRSAFDVPYHCHHCAEPIAGADVDRELRDDFAQQFHEFAPKLESIEDWLLTTEKSDLPMLEFQSIKENTITQSYWTEADYLSLKVAHAIRPLPRWCERIYARNVAVLTWSKYRKDQTITDAAGFRQVTAVYRATLRLLQRWIKSQQDNDFAAQPQGQAPEFHVDGMAVLGKWSPREFAYMLFRSAMETTQDWGLHMPIENAVFSPHVLFDHRLIRGGRLMWRARFLSIYAALFHIVSRAERYGQLNVRTIRIFLGMPDIKYMRAMQMFFAKQGVAFETVPGLPLIPFERSDKSIEFRDLVWPSGWPTPEEFFELNRLHLAMKRFRHWEDHPNEAAEMSSASLRAQERPGRWVWQSFS